MAVQNEIPSNTFIAYEETQFLVDFYVYGEDNLLITLDDNVVNSNAYTVEENTEENDEGATITFYIPITGTLVITRNTSLERITEYNNTLNNITASTLNYDFDRIYRIQQEQALATDVLDAKVIRLNQEQGGALSIEAAARVAGDTENNIYTDNRFDAIAPSLAAAADAEAFLRSYIDSVILNVSFPLDCGLISDPVINNHFDLGGL